MGFTLVKCQRSNLTIFFVHVHTRWKLSSVVVVVATNGAIYVRFSVFHISPRIAVLRIGTVLRVRFFFEVHPAVGETFDDDFVKVV